LRHAAPGGDGAGDSDGGSDGDGDSDGEIADGGGDLRRRPREAPDGRDGMLQHARELATLGIPFMFDPGQGLPMFSGDELLDFIDKAT
jgi:hypothetical protein